MSKKRIIIRVLLSILISTTLITGFATMVFFLTPQKTRTESISSKEETNTIEGFSLEFQEATK